jgi:hypothetical protein
MPMTRKGHRLFPCPVWHAAFLLVLLLASAWSATGQIAEVTDSAGIPVVVNRATFSTRWVVAAEPSLLVGDVRRTGDALSRIEGATILSDEYIVVAEDRRQTLRFYDLSGRQVSQMGGNGDEPGTFHRLRLIGPFGADSLLVYDYQQRLFSVLDGTGAFKRSFQMPAELRLGSNVIGVLDDGSPVVRRPGPSITDRIFFRRSIRIDVVSPDGRTSTSLGELPGVEQSSLRWGTAGPQANLGVSVLFGRGVHTFAARDRIAVATDDSYSVRLYEADGTIARVVRQQRNPTPVDARTHDDYVSDVLASARTDQERRTLEDGLRQMPRHETLPAFSGVHIDRLGNLWVQELGPSVREVAGWQVFDRDGSLITRVATPTGVSILEIGDDYILARIQDQRLEERVGLFELIKRR